MLFSSKCRAGLPCRRLKDGYEQEYGILHGVSLFWGAPCLCTPALRPRVVPGAEDRDGVPLPALFAARRLDLDTFFALALQVTTILAEMLPEIGLILGPQPPVPPLGFTEAQHRFIMVVQNFLAVLATPEHPFVGFLDDLQWADIATLQLLPPLLTHPDLGSVFIIGAYRDHEVSADHALRQTQAALTAAGAQLYHITVPPLGLEDLTHLVRDALHGDLAEAQPLAAA